jgi:hypothetical protein
MMDLHSAFGTERWRSPAAGSRSRAQRGVGWRQSRLVIRSQLLEEPHELDMPVGLLCQATTRPETVERAVQVQLQQISRVVGRASRGRGCGPLKAECREVEVVDKGVDATDGVLGGHGVVEPLWA